MIAQDRGHTMPIEDVEGVDDHGEGSVRRREAGNDGIW